MQRISTKPPKNCTPLILVSAKQFPEWIKGQPAEIENWIKAQKFFPHPGSSLIFPSASGKASFVLAILSTPVSLWDLAELPRLLPATPFKLEWGSGCPAPHLAETETSNDKKTRQSKTGPGSKQNRKNTHAIETRISAHTTTIAHLHTSEAHTEKECLNKLALGWLLGCYHFNRYKTQHQSFPQLIIDKAFDHKEVHDLFAATQLARDLINTTAEDLGPQELANEIKKVGTKFAAHIKIITGNDLLKHNYPAIHTVGRASIRPPRLVDLKWGNPKHPKLTIVGKGVCFDTGGLDLKPSSAMYTMKKDMGGGAVGLGLAMLIMSQKLPVNLRLLIPCVENSISGNAFRPSDIIKMRNGLTVEVGNTDAEGRLIVADALAEAAAESPDLLIDLTTLTGAARSAVGMEISAYMTNNNNLAAAIDQASEATEDWAWRLPLFPSYKRMLKSPIADLNSCPDSPYAGAITAALFLQNFIGKSGNWVHFDFPAFNSSSRPGRPEGGEAMCLRSVYQLIKKRYTSG